MYIYIYIHPYIHTYIHVCVCACVCIYVWVGPWSLPPSDEDPSAPQAASDFDPTSHADFGATAHPGVGGGTHRRRATFARCEVFVAGVRLGVWGAVLVICVCRGCCSLSVCVCVTC